MVYLGIRMAELSTNRDLHVYLRRRLIRVLDHLPSPQTKLSKEDQLHHQHSSSSTRTPLGGNLQTLLPVYSTSSLSGGGNNIVETPGHKARRSSLRCARPAPAFLERIHILEEARAFEQAMDQLQPAAAMGLDIVACGIENSDMSHVTCAAADPQASCNLRVPGATRSPSIWGDLCHGGGVPCETPSLSESRPFEVMARAYSRCSIPANPLQACPGPREEESPATPVGGDARQPSGAGGSACGESSGRGRSSSLSATCSMSDHRPLTSRAGSKLSTCSRGLSFDSATQSKIQSLQTRQSGGGGPSGPRSSRGLGAAPRGGGLVEALSNSREWLGRKFRLGLGRSGDGVSLAFAASFGGNATRRASAGAGEDDTEVCRASSDSAVMAAHKAGGFRPQRSSRPTSRKSQGTATGEGTARAQAFPAAGSHGRRGSGLGTFVSRVMAGLGGWPASLSESSPPATPPAANAGRRMSLFLGRILGRWALPAQDGPSESRPDEPGADHAAVGEGDREPLFFEHSYLLLPPPLPDIVPPAMPQEEEAAAAPAGAIGRESYGRGPRTRRARTSPSPLLPMLGSGGEAGGERRLALRQPTWPGGGSGQPLR
jgi:hypothetical protein